MITTLDTQRPASPDPTRPTAFRSPAQRQASQRNGARSRGPKTPEGKARSSRNAMTHGLLATVLAPPESRNKHNELYHKIRAELLQEFRPASFTDAALIDSLAADYVDLARVRGFVEALNTPFQLPGQETHEVRVATKAAKEHALLQEVADGLEGNWPASPMTVIAVAKLLAQAVKGIEEALAPADPNDPDGYLPLPEDEALPLQTLLDTLGPRRREWSEPNAIEIVLRRRRIPADDVKRLRALLAYALERQRQLRDAYKDSLTGIAAADAEDQRAKAADPGKQVVLRRYLSRIENVIDRKVRRLQRR